MKTKEIMMVAVALAAARGLAAPSAFFVAASAVAAPASAVAASNAAPATVAWPASLAPAWRDFEAKCAAKTATRGDLIALKRFVAASKVDAAAKTNLIGQARSAYRDSKKKESRSRK